MTHHLTIGASAAPLEAEGRLTEWLLRCFAVLAYGYAVSNLAAHWWADPSRVTLLGLLLTEGYTLTLVLIARRASLRDLSPIAVIATIYAMFFFALVRADDTRRFLPESVGVGLLCGALLWQFAAKLTLGRAFGLLPACRGIVVAGPYRVVRHPIYLGYLVGHIGFLLVNFSLRNVLVLATLYTAQVVRIVLEERLLSADAEYRSYKRRVRWRLIPGLF
jgi:protein-S-isoprenylcysteine O-methyltransferase Ste14